MEPPLKWFLSAGWQLSDIQGLLLSDGRMPFRMLVSHNCFLHLLFFDFRNVLCPETTDNCPLWKLVYLFSCPSNPVSHTFSCVHWSSFQNSPVCKHPSWAFMHSLSCIYNLLFLFCSSPCNHQRQYFQDVSHVLTQMVHIYKENFMNRLVLVFSKVIWRG